MIKFLSKSKIIFVLMILAIQVNAQHRGDNLSFQGLSEKKDFDVKSTAMGGAFTAVNGDISSLFHNPAAMIGLKNIQVSVSANYFSKVWRENQNYRPDRYFVTLPFYLEGLYIPDPKNNGKWDYELVQDTLYNYLVKEPQLGVDAYSEEAADWIKDKNKFGISNISIAVPLQFADNEFVIAASYSINDLFNFDRNDTYLDPHIGFYGYPGDIIRVDGLHTLKMKWSRFLRERSGELNNLYGALAFKLNENFSFALGIKSIWGKSDDYQSLIRVGSFLLSNQQRFSFSYEDASFVKTGASDFSSTEINLSSLITLNRFKVGLKITLPNTLTRKWNYTETTIDSSKTKTVTTNGEDKVELPASFNFGVSFQPVDVFIIDFDYDYMPYQNAKYSFAYEDQTFYKWANKNSLRFGVEFKAAKYLSILAGYRTIPQEFIPDGAAVTDKSPEANSYNLGVSLSFFFGRIDFAYELRVLKYYDSYFSNTNYAFEKSNKIMFGYTYSF